MWTCASVWSSTRIFFVIDFPCGLQSALRFLKNCHNSIKNHPIDIQLKAMERQLNHIKPFLVISLFFRDIWGQIQKMWFSSVGFSVDAVKMLFLSFSALILSTLRFLASGGQTLRDRAFHCSACNCDIFLRTRLDNYIWIFVEFQLRPWMRSITSPFVFC